MNIIISLSTFIGVMIFIISVVWKFSKFSSSVEQNSEKIQSHSSAIAALEKNQHIQDIELAEIKTQVQHNGTLLSQIWERLK